MMCERQLKEPFYAIDANINSQLLKNSTELPRNITYTIHSDHFKEKKEKRHQLRHIIMYVNIYYVNGKTTVKLVFCNRDMLTKLIFLNSLLCGGFFPFFFLPFSSISFSFSCGSCWK